MKRIVIGLPDLVIGKVVSSHQLIIAVSYTGDVQCPRCGGRNLRLKDTFRKVMAFP